MHILRILRKCNFLQSLNYHHKLTSRSEGRVITPQPQYFKEGGSFPPAWGRVEVISQNGIELRALGFGLPIISLVNLLGIYLCLPFISFVNLWGIYPCFPILSLVHIRGIIFLFSFCISCKSSGYLSLLSIVHIWGIKSLLSYCISGKSWSFH